MSKNSRRNRDKLQNIDNVASILKNRHSSTETHEKRPWGYADLDDDDPYHWSEADYNPRDDDIDIDVCQNCGGYFEWTKSLREAWQKHWLSGREPSPHDHQPQRCRSCIVDETWIENRNL